MNLVDSLLDVQQVTLGKLILVPKICQTDDLVQAAIDLLRVTAQDHRIALVTHTDLISVWADADCIVKVLTRLISNAITFSSANSTVWIVAEPINNLHVPGVQPAVRFQIRDQGQGITAPDLENIFEAFYQVDTSSSNDSGNGLSLAICRGMIEQHGGRIWIESQLGVALPFLSPYLPRSRKQQNQLA
ncbi:MAG: ATP-binding protein [Leptolyngbyaceae cyanobacterium SM1_1_3]|nr:ATP-binding protein [Leptolyngbyaceae cyanobacterium SM1_1_3]NJN01907.1 ATP-binding protein [Leptolyngbyaceae cyanobacterium RM1_1_2]NJO10904.1 ATP-binding protein [Leptolyngbyaceae cyanobacterium SL_1_1]